MTLDFPGDFLNENAYCFGWLQAIANPTECPREGTNYEEVPKEESAEVEVGRMFLYSAWFFLGRFFNWALLQDLFYPFFLGWFLELTWQSLEVGQKTNNF